MKRTNRLRTSNDFQNVYRKGVRWQTDGLKLYFLGNAHISRQRIGVVISRKMGNSVVRNQFKRRVRAWFQANLRHLPQSMDCVVLVQDKRWPIKPYGDLQKVFDTWLQGLKKLPSEKTITTPC